jgi:hypothetical protein
MNSKPAKGIREAKIKKFQKIGTQTRDLIGI